jgi:hypothetical protein
MYYLLYKSVSTAIISLNIMNKLISVMEIYCVLFEDRTKRSF